MIEANRPVSLPLVKRMLKGAIKTTAIKVGGIGITFCFFLIFARNLSGAEFGVFASAFSLAMVLAPLSSFGQQTAILRFWPSIEQAHGRDSATASLRRSFALAGAGGAFLITVGAILTFFGVDGGALGSSAEIWLATAALSSTFALSEVVTASLRAQGAIIWALLPQDILWRCLSILIILIFCCEISAIGALWITTITLASLVTIQFFILVVSNPELISWPSTRILMQEERKAMNHAVWGLWGNAILKQLQPQGSTVLVAMTLGVREAGAFFVANRLATLLAIIQIAGNMISGPMLSRAWRAQNLEEVREIIGNAIALAVPAALLGFLCYLFVGNYLLAIFDPEYTIAFLALLALSFAQLVSTICGPNDLLLLMSGHERKVLAIKTLTAFTSLTLTYVLSLIYGINGAAMGIAIGICSQNIFGVLVCKRTIKVTPSLSVSKVTSTLSRMKKELGRKLS